MSDTVKTILWIVLALIVLALLIWWFARSAAKRRELETRRLDPASLRAPAQESTSEASSSLERASATGEDAASAPSVVDAETGVHAQAAADAETAAGGLGPVTESDEAGEQEAGEQVETGSGPGASSMTDAHPAAVVAGAGAVGSAAFTMEEDEPDLADADNPFADIEAQAVSAAPPAVDVPPVAQPQHTEWAAVRGVDGDGAVVTPDAQQSESTDDADWVNGPVDDGAAVEVGEAQAGADSQAADWINGPEADEAPALPVEESAAVVSEESAASPNSVDEPGTRTVSRFDEVRDGGYGPGSAAPIADGARPLDHPIKAWRDTMTYVMPGGAGYDGSVPDVWFFDVAAARRAGFRNSEGRG